jgi:hypothetical protein
MSFPHSSFLVPSAASDAAHDRPLQSALALVGSEAPAGWPVVSLALNSHAHLAGAQQKTGSYARESNSSKTSMTVLTIVAVGLFRHLSTALPA